MYEVLRRATKNLRKSTVNRDKTLKDPTIMRDGFPVQCEVKFDVAPNSPHFDYSVTCEVLKDVYSIIQ
jgi:hypothetical protein